MSEKALSDSMVSKGVDQLIAKLRDEGVNRGEVEAKKLIDDAKMQAQAIVKKAQHDAKQLMESAQIRADEYKAAGESAIQTAMRDMVLQLKLDLTREFSDDLKRLVSHQLQKPEVLSQMILEIAGRTASSTNIDQQEKINIVLPSHVVGIDELRNDPNALASGQLMEFVFGITRDMLREGVQFSADERDDFSSGMRVKLNDKELELDLTEEAVAQILLQHLQPRFRAILEGVVK